MKTEHVFTSKDDFGLNLKYCGVEYCEPGFLMTPHRREEFLIHYVFRGSGYFQCRDKEFPLSIGSVFAIFPKEVTSYGTYPENPLNFCWMGFSGKNASRLVEMTGLSIKDPVLSLDPQNDILKIITRCVQLCKSNVPCAELEIQSMLFKFFAVIGTKKDYSQIVKTGINQTLNNNVSKAKNYIQLHFMKSLSVKDVACNINLDRTYLSKIFHLVEGITIHDYLTGFRMESAKRMLLETSYSIYEISDLVGISDAYYFSRLFKKYTGLSPSRYRTERQTKLESSPYVQILDFDDIN